MEASPPPPLTAGDDKSGLGSSEEPTEAAISQESTDSLIALLTPVVVLCLLGCCLCFAFSAIARMSPGLLPQWAKRVFQSPVYQALRWQIG